MWEGSEDDGPAYFGTKVGRCYHCWVNVDPAETVNERRLDNWEVLTCVTCVDPDKRPCQGCHQEPDGCICADIADARSY